jgi:hypothetical protein
VDVSPTSSLAAQAPEATLDWLCSEENPAVAALTLRGLLGDTGSPRARRLWAQRNAYGPVSAILGRMRPDGSRDSPGRDYQKYGGKMRADVGVKGEPSRWLTWRALTVLEHYGSVNDGVTETVS